MKDQKKLPLMAVVVALVLAFAGWMAYRSFGPPPTPPEPPKSSNRVHMEKIYQESGGDLSKLSQEDRQWLHDYSGGREQQAFDFYKGKASPEAGR